MRWGVVHYSVRQENQPMKDCAIPLSDGRRLGFIDYGDPDGLPIFLLHGTPGSRIFGLENEPLISEEALRIITPERPGYGLSSPLENRSISGYSRDIEELANYLGIRKFHVAGVSGGGPYVLACASNLPDRVVSAILIASASPMQTEGFFRGMSVGNKIAFLVSGYVPWLLKPLYQYAVHHYRKNPEKMLKGLMPHLCDWDKAVVEGIIQKGKLDGMVEHIREAYRQGYAAAYTDLYLVSRSWGIDFAEISCPIFLWHGESDTLVPISPAKAFSKTLPNCRFHAIAGAGHLLLESDEVGHRIIQAIKRVT